MELILQRIVKTDKSTCGLLSVDGNVECWTLELPIKDGLPGSAIPNGTYPVVLAPSPKFEADSQRDQWVAKYSEAIPHIQAIPNRSDILIHWGNYPTNTEGCILVGKVHQPDFVGESREAFSELWDKLNSADSITITVEDK